MGATFISLHPGFTTDAFSEILALNKIKEGRIVLFNFRVNIKFLASHSYMEDCVALKTIVLLTHKAKEFEITFLVFLIKNERILAVRSRAPSYIFLQFNCILVLEFVKLFVSFFIQNIFDVDITKSFLAFWFWTNNWEL